MICPMEFEIVKFVLPIYPFIEIKILPVEGFGLRVTLDPMLDEYSRVLYNNHLSDGFAISIGGDGLEMVFSEVLPAMPGILFVLNKQ